LSGGPRRPDLPTVTLVAVTSVALGATVDALHASMRQANFGQVLLLSDERPPELDRAIRWRRIERLGSRDAYSRFMLRDLAAHISTDHVLCIQWDGFVINGGAWDPRFLDYDYIGAVWPHFTDEHKVGNGGFSLRSRRLLEACRHLPFTGAEPEDVLIGRLQRRQLEEQGMRFAPEDVARRFSYERTNPAGGEFGFHGVFNLVRYLPASAAVRLFGSLERGLLARNERWELLRWALARGRLGLAFTMVSRLVHG
jgi:hypothetical protein